MNAQQRRFPFKQPTKSSAKQTLLILQTYAISQKCFQIAQYNKPIIPKMHSQWHIFIRGNNAKITEKIVLFSFMLKIINCE